MLSTFPGRILLAIMFTPVACDRDKLTSINLDLLRVSKEKRRAFQNKNKS
jgi:hypothetical protein